VEVFGSHRHLPSANNAVRHFRRGGSWRPWWKNGFFFLNDVFGL